MPGAPPLGNDALGRANGSGGVPHEPASGDTQSGDGGWPRLSSTPTLWGGASPYPQKPKTPQQRPAGGFREWLRSGLRLDRHGRSRLMRLGLTA